MMQTEVPSHSRPLRRLREAAIGASLLLLSLLLLLAVLELGIRLWKPGVVPELADVLEPDARLGWRVRANLNQRFEQRDAAGATRPVQLTTDARGFRYYGSAASAKPRLLFVGDSHTFGRQASQDETFPWLIARAFGAELFVLACPGYGTLQELMLLDEHIDDIRPAIVVWQLCTNDLINNSSALERRSVYHAFHVPKPYLEADSSIIYRNPAQGPWQRAAAPTHSRLLHAAALRLDHLLGPRLTEETTIERVLEREGAAHPDLDAARRITELLLARVRDRCGSVPVLAFIESNHAPFATMMMDAARNAGITVTDKVAEAFEHARPANPALVAEDGAHWTAQGHALAASTLLDVLNGMNLAALRTPPKE